MLYIFGILLRQWQSIHHLQFCTQLLGIKVLKVGIPFFAAQDLWPFFGALSRPFLLFSRKHPFTTGECESDEYDCEDQTCIKEKLRCNGNVNCRFRWDEDPEKCGVSNGQCTDVTIFSKIFNFYHNIGGRKAIGTHVNHRPSVWSHAHSHGYSIYSKLHEKDYAGS